jgi:hypothetical protein
MTYRAELSQRVLRQLGDFPARAFDALIATMAAVVEYPDDPLRTFATSDRHVRRAAFGELGLVTYVIGTAPPSHTGTGTPSTAATSPDRARTLHDHDPPRAAA